MTEQERETALFHLAKTRQGLLDAVAGVTEEQARWRPAAGRWSILEYVEHLAVSDDGLVALVKKALEGEARVETAEERAAREAAIKATAMPKGVNDAPMGLRPVGRFAGLGEAVEAFLAARERTMEFTRTTEADLRSHFHRHHVLGDLDGYQWLAGNARHAATHTAHILELKELFRQGKEE